VKGYVTLDQWRYVRTFVNTTKITFALTDSTEHSPWKSNSNSASQETARLL